MKRNIQALVIGNGAYSGPLRLSSPKNDADAMATALRDLHVSVALGSDLSYNELNEIIDKFISQVTLPSVTTSLLYYSGHGLQVQEQNYIVPIDFDRDREDNVARLISVQSILDRMSSATSVRIVLLDACRDNGSVRTFVGGKGISSNKGFFINDQPLPPAGLAEMKASSDTFIAFAAAPGDVAFEGSAQNALSPFTRALVSYLDVVDLPLSNLTSRVRRDVLEQTGGRQRTWDQSSLMSPFYFSPGSPLFFTGNFLALSGLLLAWLIFSLVLTSSGATITWIAAATALPAFSLAVLLFGTQTVYTRLRANLGWRRDARNPLRRHLTGCLRRGLLGGFLGSLIAVVPLCVPYHILWENWAIEKGISGTIESFGQLTLEATFATAFAACLLGFLCTFFARVNLDRWRLRVITSASATGTIVGSVAGGILTGLLAAPFVTWYFGSRHDRPLFTPQYLLPGAVVGAAFIVFTIINFDFDRLSSRRVLTSGCSSVIAVLAGVIAVATVFGPLYLLGAVDAVTNWMMNNADDASVLLAGGAVYGLGVGVVLGFVIGIAVVFTETWSRKPVLG